MLIVCACSDFYDHDPEYEGLAEMPGNLNFPKRKVAIESEYKPTIGEAVSREAKKLARIEMKSKFKEIDEDMI